MSRKIEDMVPKMQELYYLFEDKMAEAGIPFMVTSTYRSPEEQANLYAQGRTKPGKIVTWVKHSKHNDRKAFDIAILKMGVPVWDVKISVDGDDIPDYEEAGQIGMEIGLTWGGSWKKKDYCHFELNEKD